MLQPKSIGEYTDIQREADLIGIIPFVILNVHTISYRTVAFEEMIAPFLKIIIFQVISYLFKHKSAFTLDVHFR